MPMVRQRKREPKNTNRKSKKPSISIMQVALIRSQSEKWKSAWFLRDVLFVLFCFVYSVSNIVFMFCVIAFSLLINCFLLVFYYYFFWFIALLCFIYCVYLYALLCYLFSNCVMCVYLCLWLFTILCFSFYTWLYHYLYGSRCFLSVVFVSYFLL